MTTQATDEAGQQPSSRPTVWSRWPEWVGYAAAVASAIYGVLGLIWATGGAGFPFGLEHDPGAEHSLLEHAAPEVTGVVIAVVGLAGSVIATRMGSRRIRRRRGALLVFAWALGVGLTLVITDYRSLLALIRAPMLLIGRPLGLTDLGASDYFELFLPWPVVNQIVLILIGTLWAGTAIAYRRRGDRACLECGRSATATTGWTSPESAARWGRWAVAAAVAAPVFYAATRWAWALGVPFGVSRRGLESEAANSPGIWLAGAILATMALGGATLTLGLVQKWGEVYPRWIPRLRGRPVRPRAAIIPATVVAILLTQAGLMQIRWLLDGRISIQSEEWGLTVPGLLYVVWGVALGVATLAYHLRRRAECRACGRSGTPVRLRRGSRRSRGLPLQAVRRRSPEDREHEMGDPVTSEADRRVADQDVG